MTEIRMKCFLCKKNITKIIYSKPPFKIVECVDCNMGYLSPMPKNNFLDSFYSKEYFQKKSDSFGYSDYRSMGSSLDKESERKLKFINKYVKKGNLLDVGAGLGNFAYIAKKKDFRTIVLDRSKWAVDYISKKFGLTGISSSLNTNLKINNLDVITAWDVIEHLTDPLKSLGVLNSSLRKGGLLFITTPNLYSIDAKLMQNNWYGFKKIPEHVLYFSPKAVRILAEKSGFEVLEIKSWGFVRTVNFILEKISTYNKLLAGILKVPMDLFKIGNKNVYFPFIDMMIVLKKK